MLRVFYNQPFANIMEIDDQQKVHHLTIVLRIKNGDEVYLVNQSEVAKTKVIAISKTSVSVQLIEVVAENNELPAKINLGFGPLKGDNTQLVIQKAVELGASHIDLVNFKRNVSKFDSKKADKKLDKFSKIIEGACLQSRRNIVPTINVNVDLTGEYLSQFDLVVVCFENEESNHLNHYCQQITESTNILVLIGPEGGIDDSEIDMLMQYPNVKIATLGKRIMRAETASISSLAMIALMMEGN